MSSSVPTGPQHHGGEASDGIRRGLLLPALAGPLLLASRLPLLLGSPLVPDGDEGILGLMALRAAGGEGIPRFFWGQGYGFSAVEVAAAAVSFRLFGADALPLALAMLVLWCAGGVVLALAARRLAGSGAGWLALLLLASCPAWGAWAAKARGGYLTALLASAVAAWLLAAPGPAPGRRRGLRGVAVGAALAVTAFAQPLFLVLPLPLLALHHRIERPAGALAAVAGGAAVVVAWLLPGRPAASFWSPEVFQHPSPATALVALPGRLFTLFTGSYRYELAYAPGPFASLAALAWSAGALAAVVAVVALAGRRRGSAAEASLTAGFLAALGASLTISLDAFGYRYLLPAGVPLVLLLALLLTRAWRAGMAWRAPAAAAAALLVLSGGLSLLETARVPPRSIAGDPYRLTAEDLAGLVAELRQHGVRHVYSLDPLLQWNLMFATREGIAARWLSEVDRRPEIPAAVDRALRGGQPVALVGRTEQLTAVAPRAGELRSRLAAARPVGRDLFVLGSPDPELLRRLGFRFRAPVRPAGPQAADG